MNGAFYIAATGLRAEQRALDTTANNIANINTLGFKRSEARFSELMAAGDASSDRTAQAPDLLSGVSVGAEARVFSQGELRQTGKPMDIAIQGDGFIELLGPQGAGVAWRGGGLKVNDDGFLAASNGMPLKAMISVPKGAQSLTIERDGKVHALVDGETVPTELGQIDILTINDAAGLTPLSDGVYALGSTNAGQAAVPGEEGSGVLIQGSVEASNVELSDEMITLLITQRAYAANAQVVQAGDQLMAIANGLKR